MRINAHGHLLPYPEEIPEFMKEEKVFWLDNDRRFMRQGDWKRPVTDPSFFLDEKLVWMAKNNIDHEVVLNLSQLYCNGMPKELTREVLKFQNDFNASVMKRHPEKFTTGFVVQPLYVEDALDEINRCVQEHDMSLLCLPTHFQLGNGKWCSVADERVHEIWQLADDHGLAVEIHPYDGDKIIALENEYWRFHLVWMCALTADTYHFYTMLNMPVKYPNVRTCFAHGNQFGQINTGRRMQGFVGRPDLFVGATSPDESIGHKNIYFDTLVHDLLSFKMLKERQGVGQIVAGLDDPYPLGEMESVPGCYPGKVIDEALEANVISEGESKEIWNGNVGRWLNKEFN
jgi:aminocarboxymuconate-semialdehyde decarboxylase